MMYCDNTATVSFSNNLKGNPGARYIDVKYFVVKEKVEEGLITIGHTLTYSVATLEPDPTWLADPNRNPGDAQP